MGGVFCASEMTVTSPCTQQRTTTWIKRKNPVLSFRPLLLRPACLVIFLGAQTQHASFPHLTGKIMLYLEWLKLAELSLCCCWVATSLQAESSRSLFLTATLLWSPSLQVFCAALWTNLHVFGVCVFLKKKHYYATLEIGIEAEDDYMRQALQHFFHAPECRLPVMLALCCILLPLSYFFPWILSGRWDSLLSFFCSHDSWVQRQAQWQQSFQIGKIFCTLTSMIFLPHVCSLWSWGMVHADSMGPGFSFVCLFVYSPWMPYRTISL